MGRANLIQTNFTGGELSTEIALGRMDIAKYNNGARTIENCSIRVQGGAKRRPGTRFIAATKTASKKARLIDFVYNRGQAYMLELGEGYMRFFKERAQIVFGGPAVEVAGPHTEAQLFAVNYVQKADTGFFVHEGVFPWRLQRFSDVHWGFGPTPFLTPPYEEQGHNPPASLTLSNVGPGVATANASATVFLKSDVGRHISLNGGYAEITAWSSYTLVTINIITPFKSTSLGFGLWNIDGSPQAGICPSSEGIVGKQISLNANFTYFGTSKTIAAIVSGFGSVAVQCIGHGFSNGDTIGISGTFADGVYVIGVIDADHFAYASDAPPNQILLSGTCSKAQVSVDSEVWRSFDVGSYVSINGGLFRIDTFVNTTTVVATTLRAAAAKVPAGPNAWSLERVAWDSSRGYPRAVTINKQRLMFAGSPGYPQNVWASGIQTYLSFQFGVLDDEAFRFELDGPRNSPILHIAPTRQILVLTEADEMSLKGGNEKPITPTNIQKTDESTSGARGVRPVKIGNEILFVQAAGKKICAAAYRFDIDGYQSPDRTVFAAHITGAGITQLAHQKEPDSTVYAVRTDGQMAVCAYDVDQEVVGWSRWLTDGAFESVATIPTPTAEDVYVIVQRSINGNTVRYVEVLDPDVFLDCAITGTSVGGQTTWSGLSHLEGKTVQAWADGAYMGEYVVASGAITLPRAANSVQIGLGFTSKVELLQPEVGGNGTTAQGSQVHVNEVVLRVLNTSAALINGEPVEFRRFGSDLLDLPPPMYTGDVRLTTLSDSIFTTSQVITQPYPLPFHLLDVIRRVTINGE